MLEKDLAELEEALRENDREAMRRIVHRMAPVWELLGANDVLFGYRKLLHDKTSSDETVREYTMRIMKQIRLLIDEVNNELRKKNDKKEVKPLVFDLENSRDRVIRLTVNSSRLGDAVLTPYWSYYRANFPFSVL